MSTLFISHSSKDKTFAQQLASDLRELGHEVWLDEWEIRVGDCIVTKVEEGLLAADYVVLVLSKHSVESGWVEREWKTKYWDEIQSRQTMLLPALLEDCTIPPLLQTKKYADFRDGRRAGLAELAIAIQPLISTDESEIAVHAVDSRRTTLSAPDILVDVQSSEMPLSQSLAVAMALAHQVGDVDLASFCERELTGYSEVHGDPPPWRVVKAYVSVKARLNPQYIGFSGNTSAAIDMMEHDEDFFTKQIFVSFPVPELERRPESDMLSMGLRVGDLLKDAQHPATPAIAYLRGDAFSLILTSVKTELTRLLIKHLEGSE